jgi:hypothetical protein
MAGCHRATVVYWSRTPPVFSRLAHATPTQPFGSARTAAVGEAFPNMSEREGETICLEEPAHPNAPPGAVSSAH